MNVQVIATAEGEAIEGSPASLGSNHVITAARDHVLDEIAPYISRHTPCDGSTHLVVLADKGLFAVEGARGAGALSR